MTFRLAFCCTNSNPFYEAVLRGVRKRLEEEGEALLPWSGSYQIPMAAIPYLKPDGLFLGAMQKEELPPDVRALPHIGFSNFYPDGIRPAVVNDDMEAGRTAAREVIEAGYQQMALLCLPKLWHTHLRIEGAREEAEALGLTCYTHDMTLREPQGSETFQDVWISHQKTLRTFLKSLPRNTGLVVTNLSQALEARSILREQLQRGIPEDIGLLVVDVIDPLDHDLAIIELDGEEVGDRLVNWMLDQLRSGTNGVVFEKVPPRGLVPGGSFRRGELTEVFRRLKTFCLDHLTEPLSVERMSQHVGLSRRSLEMKLQAAGMLSPYEFLTELRLAEAKRRLRSTDAHMEEIAEQSGFTDARAMRKRFQARLGVSPREWRRQHRAGV